MVYQIIEAGGVYEIETSARCRIERTDQGKPVLVVSVGDVQERLEPHAIVRAAKDNLLGLTCSRSWRIDGGACWLDPGLAIREIALNA
jgi:hypothetical protein